MTEFKQQISEMTLIPAGGGAFELSVDGDLIYSKLQTGQFPDEGSIIKKLRARSAVGVR